VETPILRAERLTRAFPAPFAGGSHAVLQDLTLSVAHQSSVAFMGPSGSGKTTLLHLLGALSRPDSGGVWLDGTRLDDLNDADRAALRRRHLGFVFQDHALMPHLSALENVLVPTLGAPDLALAAEARAEKMLTEVGLKDRLHHRPAQLSLGQCQRVAVCRARINRPKLLLADEPTGALDRDQASRLIGELLSAQAGEGCALIVATHDERIATRFDRILDLVDGRLTERSRAPSGVPS
jgi:ABC-type lipoprotein export system ATPase subunit